MRSRHYRTDPFVRDSIRHQFPENRDLPGQSVPPPFLFRISYHRDQSVADGLGGDTRACSAIALFRRRRLFDYALACTPEDFTARPRGIVCGVSKTQSGSIHNLQLEVELASKTVTSRYRVSISNGRERQRERTSCQKNEACGEWNAPNYARAQRVVAEAGPRLYPPRHAGI